MKIKFIAIYLFFITSVLFETLSLAESRICDFKVMKDFQSYKMSLFDQGCTIDELKSFYAAIEPKFRRNFLEMIGNVRPLNPRDLDGRELSSMIFGGQGLLSVTIDLTKGRGTRGSPSGRTSSEPTPSSPNPSPSYEELIGANRNYHPGEGVQYGSYRFEAQNESFVNEEQLQTLANLGYLATQFSSLPAAIQAFGRKVSVSVNIVLFGKKFRDEIADADLAWRRDVYRSMIQRWMDEVSSAIQKTAEMRDLHSIEITHSLDRSKQHLSDIDQLLIAAQQKFTENLETSRNLVQVSSTYVTEALKELQRTERDRQTLDQGLLTTHAILKAQQALQEFERSEDPGKVAERISGLQGQMAQSPHAGRREQYENVLRSITDSRGLLLSALLVTGFPAEISLKTEETSQVGRAVRQNLNEALGWSTKVGATRDVTPTIDMILKADAAFGRGDKIEGNRLLNRARSFMDYATSHPRVQSYNAQIQTAAAAERYGRMIANSYETYQSLKVGNVLAEIPASSFSEETYFLSMAAVRQLQNRLNTDDSFNKALDIAYSVADFTLGVGTGLTESAKESLVGLMTLTAPQGLYDTSVNLAIALTQLPELAEHLYGSTMKLIQEFPDYSTRRQGELTGKILFEVATFVFTKGLGKPGSSAATIMEGKGFERLAVGLERIGDSAKNLGIKGEEIAGVTKEVDHLAHGKVLGIYEAAAKNKPLGLGSTGRSVPSDLQEQAAMLVTRADPQAGTPLSRITMSDPRWPASDGWQKWQTTTTLSDGRRITIHYNRNIKTGQVDDFKFINEPVQ